MKLKEKFAAPEKALRLFFWLLTLAFLVGALLMPDRSQMFEGLKRLCLDAPSQVTKSYFDGAYGGFAGTFLNAALVCAVCSLIYCLPGSKPEGVAVLAFVLTAGFCFWGTNILNIWFCFAGVGLYCLVKGKQFGAMANAALFSTGLTPLITDLLFRYPGESWHGFTAFGIILALVVGCFIGFVLPGGLGHSPKMHKGFDLYSAAVPMGLLAFFLRAALYKVLGGYLPEAQGVGLGDSFPLICLAFAGAVFVLAIVLGLLLGGSFRQYGALLKADSFGADFGASHGAGTAIMNFGIYGLFILAYYCAVGAKWNAVTLGCVFCMVCCCFKGSNPRTVWPIMLGYVLASFASKALCGVLGTEFSLAINAQAIVVGLCFANGLSPVTGKYGWWAGLGFAVAHYTLVTCVPLLHGGFLLYNGGFTAAVICFIFIPVMEHFFKTKDEKLQAK